MQRAIQLPVQANALTGQQNAAAAANKPVATGMMIAALSGAAASAAPMDAAAGHAFKKPRCSQETLVTAAQSTNAKQAKEAAK